MILADKIILLRKKNGWSQEELAEKMNVSRQAVSKWEAAQSTPDLEKILMLGNLFDVTTDYLLKDEMEIEEYADNPCDSICRSITLEEANAYINHQKWASTKIAFATLLCIISPIYLFILAILSEKGNINLTEDAAGLLGLIVLLLHIAAAVMIYLYVDAKNRPYKFLEEEPFELAYGVSGMIREKQKKYHNTYTKGNMIGTCLCILAPIVLFMGAVFNDTVAVFCLSAMFVIIGIGVWQYISVGVKWASMKKLLQEGEYSKKGKKRKKISETVGTVFWLVATAIYLGWSFSTGDWEITWLVWPIAGVLYAALNTIINLIISKDEY